MRLVKKWGFRGCGEFFVERMFGKGRDFSFQRGDSEVGSRSNFLVFERPPSFKTFPTMFNWLIKKIIGSKNTRMVKRLRPTIAQINQLEVEYQQLSDEALRAKTAAWKAGGSWCGCAPARIKGRAG